MEQYETQKKRSTLQEVFAQSNSKGAMMQIILIVIPKVIALAKRKLLFFQIHEHTPNCSHMIVCETEVTKEIRFWQLRNHMAFGQCPWNDWTFVGTKLDGCVSGALSVKASFPAQGGSTFLHPHKEFSKVYNFFCQRQ